MDMWFPKILSYLQAIELLLKWMNARFIRELLFKLVKIRSNYNYQREMYKCWIYKMLKLFHFAATKSLSINTALNASALLILETLATLTQLFNAYQILIY